MGERPLLFQFLDLVAIALVRPNPRTRKPFLTPAQAATAVLLVNSGRGTSGQEIAVDADRLATEMGVSARTAWRYFSSLVAHADDPDRVVWFVQTQAPQRSPKGEEGSRRARYRVTLPGLDLALGTGLLRLTHPSEALSDGPTDVSSDRVTNLARPSDSSARPRGAVLPSEGSPDLSHPYAGSSGRALEGHGWMPELDSEGEALA